MGRDLTTAPGPREGNPENLGSEGKEANLEDVAKKGRGDLLLSSDMASLPSLSETGWDHPSPGLPKGRSCCCVIVTRPGQLLLSASSVHPFI